MPTSEHDKQLAAALDGMPVDHVHCRDYGHSWAPWKAAQLPRNRGFDQWLRCKRCSSVRHRVLSRYGDVLASSYVYADGYLIPGLGRLSGADRGQLRLTSIMDTINTKVAP